MLCLDMSKAFERINHKRLIQKLANSGVGGKLLKWFQFCLTDRRQRVTYCTWRNIEATTILFGSSTGVNTQSGIVSSLRE